MRWTARGAVLAVLPALASCAGVVSRSGIISFLEAVQRPFDLHDRTWLGIPAELLAHLIVSASLAGAVAWFWRPKAAAVLLGILILTKEAVDLMNIALYQPVTWAYASGSVVDVLASVAGASLGLWLGTRARRRSSKTTETGIPQTPASLAPVGAATAETALESRQSMPTRGGVNPPKLPRPPPIPEECRVDAPPQSDPKRVQLRSQLRAAYPGRVR